MWLRRVASGIVWSLADTLFGVVWIGGCLAANVWLSNQDLGAWPIAAFVLLNLALLAGVVGSIWLLDRLRTKPRR